MKKLVCQKCGAPRYSSTGGGKCPRCGGKLVQVEGWRASEK